MVVMTPSTIMPPQTCDNYNAKKCILELHRDLDPWSFDPKIWRIHPCPKSWKVWGNSTK